MKIPSKFKVLQKEKSLLLVTGKLVAKYFSIDKGIIELLGEIRIEKPKYTDKEGFFERRGKSQSFGFGSVLESKDDKMEKEFTGKLNTEIKKLVEKYQTEKIYLLCPEYMKGIVYDALPASALKKLQIVEFFGNFINEHPLRLLERVKMYNKAK